MRCNKKAEERFDEIESFIADYKEQYGTSPSMQKIGDAIGIARSAVFKYLCKMEEAGRIERRGNKGYFVHVPLRGRIPILGRISCGTPLLAEENLEGYIDLPENLFGSGQFFFLRAKGDSMIEAGINSGDLVLIRQQETAEPGEIVVALVNDQEDATLKRFYPEPENQRIRLHPENSDLSDMYYPEITIQGIAVKVIKDL